MSSLSETSLSLFASAPPTSTTPNVTIGVLVLIMMAFIIHFASPMRLTRVSVAAISNVEKIYLEAIEAGMLSNFDVNTALMLLSLQIKISRIREETLRNSLSHFAVLCDFFKGRSFTILKCIREVHRLEVHLELLKEEHLRDPNPLGATIGTISLRKRHTYSANVTISYTIRSCSSHAQLTPLAFVFPLLCSRTSLVLLLYFFRFALVSLPLYRVVFYPSTLVSYSI
ncbi:hypothetical protein C8R44DRAFT_791443 [Mycena epipterygia]|nr:hypothetical protein C8R44DRAFT_791443 [Mycena epipterygia]